MPGMRGVEVTRTLDEVLPDVVVLALTVSEEHEDVLEACARRARLRGKSSAQEEVCRPSSPPRAARRGCRRRWRRRLVDSSSTLPAVALEETLKEETHLTPREQMVLARLAQGMTNAQIAAALGIAETTVKTHLQHILDKLHARNRLEAASFALKLGLVDPNA